VALSSEPQTNKITISQGEMLTFSLIKAGKWAVRKETCGDGAAPKPHILRQGCSPAQELE